METYNPLETREKRKEYKSLTIVGGILGTVHTGLIMAAEGVNCLEAAITDKITKGDISYEEQKYYRNISSLARTELAKDKIKDFGSKLKDLKAKGVRYSHSTPKTV